MYTIGEVSKMFSIPISTLRYYDNKGLFLNIERTSSGNRKFSDKDLETIRVIECLKRSGMTLDEIEIFMKWCSMGDKTIEKRKEMFYKKREDVKKQLEEVKKTLDFIEFKCWYYDMACKENSEKRLKEIKKEDLPLPIRRKYEHSHS